MSVTGSQLFQFFGPLLAILAIAVHIDRRITRLETRIESLSEQLDRLQKVIDNHLEHSR